MRGFVKKYRWALVGLGVLLLVVVFNVWIQDRVTSSSRDEVTTESPADVAMKVHISIETKDNKTYFQYLIPSEQKFLLERDHLGFDPNRGKQRDWSLPERYRLIEYKVTDDLYYYHLQYSDTVRSNYYYKIIRTKGGWKTWTYFHFDTSEFKYETQGMTPRIVREAKG